VKRFRGILVLPVLAASASGCSRSLPVACPTGLPIEVSELVAHKTYSLQPGSSGHDAMVQWSKEHLDGWSPYLATPPSSGVIARCGDVQFQFGGPSVLVRTSGGFFQHFFSDPPDYGFLHD